MEPEVRERFERIEAILHAMVERENQMEIRFNRRMEQFNKRQEQFNKRQEQFEKRQEQYEKRMERSEERTAKLERQILVTQKLVQEGMKIVIRQGQRQAKLEATVQALVKSQKLFLDSLRGGGNGSR